LNTLTGDIQTIQSFASTSTLNILTDVLSLVGMIAVMFLLRWDFPFIALAVTPLLAAFALRVNKAVTAAVSEVRNRQSDLLATLQEGLQSIEVIKAFEGEGRQEQQLQKVSTEMVTAWLQARRVSALTSPSVTLAVAVCTGLVLWRGSLLVLSGAITIGSLSVFPYLARFFQPARGLAQMTNTIATVSVGFQRVTAVCDADTVIPERPAPRDPAPFLGEITFENVSFAYDPDLPVLRDITFDVEPGETVGIIGPTGSGKSTAVSLIPRFRDRDGGRISIDGVDTGPHQRLRTREASGRRDHTSCHRDRDGGHPDHRHTGGTSACRHSKQPSTLRRGSRPR
jgi:ABC-type multidrug transport system fused ATPase/permease subunit